MKDQKRKKPLVSKTKRLPKRKKETISIRAAKRFWFAPRSRGRRSKAMSEKLAIAKEVLVKAKVPLEKTRAIKAHGRPRKHPISNKPKRARGRPRKHPEPDPNKPKRARGRPRKHPKPDPNKPKRARGRPRKHPKPDPVEYIKKKRKKND